MQVALHGFSQSREFDGQFRQFNVGATRGFGEFRELGIHRGATTTNFFEALGAGTAGFELLTVGRLQGRLVRTNVLGGDLNNLFETTQGVEFELQATTTLSGDFTLGGVTSQTALHFGETVPIDLTTSGHR